MTIKMKSLYIPTAIMIITTAGLDAFSAQKCQTILIEARTQKPSSEVALPKRPEDIDLATVTPEELDQAMIAHLIHFKLSPDYKEQFKRDPATARSAVYMLRIAKASSSAKATKPAVVEAHLETRRTALPTTKTNHESSPSRLNEITSLKPSESSDSPKVQVSNYPGMQEIVSIIEPYGMHRIAPLIPRGTVSNVNASTFKDTGEQETRIQLRAFGPPQLSGQSTLLLGTKNSSSTQVSIHSQRADMTLATTVNTNPVKPLPKLTTQNYESLSDAQKKEILSFYVNNHLNAGNRWSPEVVKAFSDNIGDIPTGTSAFEYVKKLNSMGGQVRETMHSLSTNGLDRYFMFLPQDKTTPVMTRVLDIHNQTAVNPYANRQEFGARITVEIMEPTNQSGVRRRTVRGLSEQEVQTITATSLEDRKAIKQHFYDQLTPMELEAIQMARQFQLRTFGYSDYRRHNSATSEWNQSQAESLGSVLTDPLHLISSHYISQHFGEKRLTDIMNEAELERWKAYRDVNVFDLMARLSPREVLARFPKIDKDYVYTFVATEDGNLKISPYGFKSQTPSTMTSRLAHGRRIYATGYFSLNGNGGLHLTLDASGNRTQSFGQGGQGFRVRNGDINSFLAYIFKAQAGHPVETIDDELTLGRKTGPAFDWTKNSKNGSEDNGFDDTWSGLKGQQDVYNRTAKAEAFAPWDSGQENARPLNLTDWCKKFGFDANGPGHHIIRRTHAFWVLNADPTKTTIGEIKKTFRKLASRFHPDKQRNSADTEAMQVINAAWTKLELETRTVGDQ